ncbi:MAG: hypothetical protein IIA87_03355 [Nanoarchaeota archaeon]|nr:hypothetical protein [Nanoarchaeota archaeon]
MISVRAATLDGNFFNVKVTPEDYLVVRKLLERERTRIIDKLKTYHVAGFINSIFRPRNKAMQKELDELVLKKRALKKSINQINQIFK